jgi:uroporphyrinogen-III synthase
MKRVMVTRPAREAQKWVRDLLAHGFDATALPLIKVGPVLQTADLDQAWQHIDDYVGVMFVSGNAATYFFAAQPAVVSVFLENSDFKTRAWATGPGTASALLQGGVAPTFLDAPLIDAPQFDSEALWHLVGKQVTPGSRVLIVRGSDASGRRDDAAGVGREWFADRVKAAGGRVDFVAAYQRGAPELSEQELEMARRAAIDGSIWLFSSSEALANLLACLPEQNWRLARALTTHPRITLAVKNAGFAQVDESRPTLNDVMASLKLMRPNEG